MPKPEDLLRVISDFSMSFTLFMFFPCLFFASSNINTSFHGHHGSIAWNLSAAEMGLNRISPAFRTTVACWNFTIGFLKDIFAMAAGRHLMSCILSFHLQQLGLKRSDLKREQAGCIWKSWISRRNVRHNFVPHKNSHIYSIYKCILRIYTNTYD